jgi:tripartite-type tricarboxylate transporter receptor subunit TctC
MIDRRQFVAAALSTAAMPSAFAQTAWEPKRNIQIIVGFQAGGGTDVIARLYAQAAGELTGGKFVVVNRPGGAGAIAADAVAHSEPDGYTMLLGGGSESTTQPHYVKLNYKLEDFRAVGRVNREHMVLVTSSKGQFKSVDDIVKAAKKEPGKIVYGSSGVGGILHAAFQAFERAAGIELNHVPYRGGADAFKDVLSGNIDMTLVIPAEAKSQQEGGNANIVATMSDRSTIIPDVKGMSELGYAVSMDNMKGLLLPVKTPDDIAKYHETLFNQVMKGQRVVELAQRMNIELGYMDGPTFMKAMLATSQQVMELRKK